MSEPHTSGGHRYRHGKPSSWAVVALILLSVVVGGVALILQIRWLLFVCAGVFLAGVPLGALVRIMDDTVAYTLPPAYRPHPPGRPHPEDPGTPVTAAEPADATDAAQAAGHVNAVDSGRPPGHTGRLDDREETESRQGEAGARRTRS